MALTSASAPVVLVGFAEAFAAIEAIWSLQRAGMRVVMFSRAGTRPAARAMKGAEVREIRSPELDLHGSLDDLAKTIQRVAPDAILPLDDASLWMTSRVDLHGAVLVGPTPIGAAFALNKADQITAAVREGIRVPTTVVFADVAEVTVHDDSWPVILKPADAVLQIGNSLVRPQGRICASPAELDTARSVMRPGTVLAQQLVSGSGEGLFGFAGDHGPEAWSAHRRVRMLNPHGSASSACESMEVDDDLRTRVSAMLTTLSWRGLFMAEFLTDASGTAWFMELNGRAWGSLALARRRGFEYPSWAVQSALGLPQHPLPPLTPPRIVARHLGREIGHLGFVLRGPQTTAPSAWPSTGRTVRSLMTIGRSDRLYNWDPRNPRVLAADTWRTLADLTARRGRKPA